MLCCARAGRASAAAAASSRGWKSFLWFMVVSSGLGVERRGESEIHAHVLRRCMQLDRVAGRRNGMVVERELDHDLGLAGHLAAQAQVVAEIEIGRASCRERV